MSNQIATPTEIPEVGQVQFALVADCGSSLTRVALIEQVDNTYRFVARSEAPTTVEPPWSDISVGFLHAVSQLEEIVGRPLLDEQGHLIIPTEGTAGVDLLVVTSSAAQPLRVVLAGLVREISVASLERAAQTSYVRVLDTIAPSGADLHQRDNERIRRIRQHRPDVVWVAGGTDGGASQPVLELVETVALACSLMDSAPQPDLVYAGNAALRAQIAEILGDEIAYIVVDNVRPSLDVENLTTAEMVFDRLYQKRKLGNLPGIHALQAWSTGPILPTARAFGYLVNYLDYRYEGPKGVLGVDVGSANTVVAASFNGRLSMTVRTDLGVGHNALATVESRGIEAIQRWLPFPAEPGEILTVAHNQVLWPATIPLEKRELIIQQAIAREALRAVLETARAAWRRANVPFHRRLAPQVEPIIARGTVLTRAPRPGQAALMLLDALEPVGITTLLLDPYDLAPGLGAVATLKPLVAVDTLDGGAFVNLGTVISPIGRARPGDIVLRIKLTYESGGGYEVDVRYGTLELHPLPPGEKARLELRPRRGIDVGRGGPGRGGGPIEIPPSLLGLIVDARGRPLRLPANPGARREQVKRWMRDMGV